jgi:DNA-binding MarR family transcriptional regulator
VDQLTGELGSLMKAIMAATSREFFAELERQELRLGQVKALGTLAEAGEPLSLKALSERIGLSLPGMSRSVDVLVQRGLVKRDEDPEDRRSKRVGLTAKGRRTFEGLVELRIARLREWVERLDADQRAALSEGINAVRDHTA